MSTPADLTPAPLRGLPRLSADEASAYNQLAASGRVFAFPWAGKPATLRFTATPAAGGPLSSLRIQLGGHSAALGLCDDPEPARLGVEFAGIELAGLPDDLKLGVLGSCLEGPIAVLRSHGLSLALESWIQEPPAGTASLGWELALGGQRLISGTLNAAPQVLALLEQMAGRVLPQPIRNADALPVALRVALAELSLPLHALQALAPGDVLLPPLTREHWDAGRCTLWADQQRIAEATFQQNQVQLIVMKDSARATPAPPTASPIQVNDLPVQLLFEVGQVDLTVGQLRTLGEGYTFALPATPDRFVTVRANGREIGRGELVDLGDKLGVRLSSWNLL